MMILPIEDLSAFVTETIRQVKLGVQAARLAGHAIAELPEKIDIQVQLVTSVQAIEMSKTATTVSNTLEGGATVEAGTDETTHSESGTATETGSQTTAAVTEDEGESTQTNNWVPE